MFVLGHCIAVSREQCMYKLLGTAWRLEINQRLQSINLFVRKLGTLTKEATMDSCKSKECLIQESQSRQISKKYYRRAEHRYLCSHYNIQFYIILVF